MNALITAMVTNGIGAVCAAAVLWFAWHRETKTIPHMMGTFSKALETAQSAFIDRNDKALETFAQLTREERTLYQKWHDENRDRLDRILVENKEHSHYLSNLAHSLGLRQALEEQRTKERDVRERAVKLTDAQAGGESHPQAVKEL